MPDYKLISPRPVAQISQSLDLNKQYMFNVFGVDYHLYLIPYTQLISPGMCKYPQNNMLVLYVKLKQTSHRAPSHTCLKDRYLCLEFYMLLKMLYY